MKVLRVISSMDPRSGGPCQGIRNALPEMAKLGIETEVVCLDSPDKSFFRDEVFPLTGLGPAKSAWCYSPRLMPWLLANLGRFDVVIVHGLWQYHGFAVLKALNRLKKKGTENKLPKFYVMPHGMLDPYFQKAEERKLKAIRNRIYWQLIENKIVNSADGLLFTCKAELLLARESFQPYHPKQEINVGYGIESPPGYESSMKSVFLEKCPQLNGEPYFLFLSRIHEKKGIDHLLEAYSELAAKIKMENGVSGANKVLPKLVVAGPGIDTPFGNKIIQMVSSSELLKDVVFFPGMLSGNAKWGAFYGSEAFILPSHQENFGIAVAEAMACGKPVLISKQVNIWHEIAEAGGGLVEEDSTLGALKLLQSWIEMPVEQKKAMGENAFEGFKGNFSIVPASRRFVDCVCKELIVKPTI